MEKKEISICLIGHGNIGKELEKTILEKGWQIPFIIEESGIYNLNGLRIDQLKNWKKYLEKVDIVCLAIPSLDDGLIAYEYIKTLRERGIPVVTSEKGALGNYFPELKSQLHQIGYSATVGGGTGLIHWLKERLTPGTKEIHLIINGTLNYIFDGLSRGRTLNELTEEAKKLGYAEPGAKNALEVINTESCKDIPLKISILLNICGFGEIRAKDISAQRIDEVTLKKLIREAIFRRYIISINREEQEEDVILGFKFPFNEWWISAGFKNQTQNPLFLQLVPPGVNNAALIHGIEGTYILTGPGAGATPTVMGAMMKDIEALLKMNHLTAQE